MSTLGHYCPDCHELVSWSKPRHFLERWLRKLTPYSPYMCNACGWRGWMRSGRKMKQWRIVFVVVMLVVSLAAVGFVLSRFYENLSPNPVQTPAKKR